MLSNKVWKFYWEEISSWIFISATIIRSNHNVQNVFYEQFKDGWKVAGKSSFLIWWKTVKDYSFKPELVQKMNSYSSKLSEPTQNQG